MAQQIAKSKKLQSNGQELILSVATEMCEAVLGSEAANKLKIIPLSNDTMKGTTVELLADIQSQLVDRLGSCEQFSIQLLGSTDISSSAQIIVLVRYPWKRNILEDFCLLYFCREVLSRTSGEEIFKLLDEFMTKVRLSWEK